MVACIGFIAGVLTTGAWIPQVMRTWRLRSTGDIAWPYLAATSVGVALWLYYGIAIGNAQVIAPNAVSLVLILGMAVLKAIEPGAGLQMPDASAETVDVTEDAEPARAA